MPSCSTGLSWFVEADEMILSTDCFFACFRSLTFFSSAEFVCGEDTFFCDLIPISCMGLCMIFMHFTQKSSTLFSDLLGFTPWSIRCFAISFIHAEAAESG